MNRTDEAEVVMAEERPDCVGAVELLSELDRYLRSFPYPPESQHAFTVEQLLREKVAFFMTRVDGQPAGCGGVKLCDDFGEVKRMYTRPAYRGRGLGTAVLKRLSQHASDHGRGILRLETGIYQTEAIALYEKFGFKRCLPFGEYKDDPMSVYFEVVLT